ncbi:MAG: hypothetical protein Q8R43_01095, partial [Alphaproteobacteria bacterium]|nr:hypothetical protein [Alphaproteobacteria bacterium]
ELLANAEFEVITEEQERAITRNGLSLGFLRKLYEAHYEVLKGYLDSIAIFPENAATVESSNEESIEGTPTDGGVFAEQGSAPINEYDLTSEQQDYLDGLYELEQDRQELSRLLSEAEETSNPLKKEDLRKADIELSRTLRHGFDEYYAKYFDGKPLRETFGSEAQLDKRRTQYEEIYHENYDFLEDLGDAGDSIKAEELKKKEFVLVFLLKGMCRYRHAIDNTPEVQELREEETIFWDAYQLIKNKLEEIESTGDEAAISSQKEKVDEARNEWWTAHIRIDDVVITEHKETFVDRDSDVDEVEEAKETFTRSNERGRPVETAEVRPVEAFLSEIQGGSVEVRVNLEEDRLWQVFLQAETLFKEIESSGNESEIAKADERMKQARSAWYTARNNVEPYTNVVSVSAVSESSNDELDVADLENRTFPRLSFESLTEAERRKIPDLLIEGIARDQLSVAMADFGDNECDEAAVVAVPIDDKAAATSREQTSRTVHAAPKQKQENWLVVSIKKVKH